MARFVLLEHDHPFLHWDFMLQDGEKLRTWRLLEPPEPGKIVPAEALGDHRLAYLDYEGPVSGNRGHVKRWDAGTYTGKLPDEIPSGKEVVLYLAGQRLAGSAVLRRSDNEWTLDLRSIIT